MKKMRLRSCKRSIHRGKRFIKTTLISISLALTTSLLLTAAAWAFPVNQCSADRFGSDMGCTANDVSISAISAAAGSPLSCVGGQSLILDMDVTINAANAKRYDIGVFLSNDGKSTRLTSANGGASTCSVSMIPQTPLPFANLDSDVCGDIDGPGSGIFRMSSVTVLCSAAGSTSGNLTIPFMVTWSANAGGVCSSNADPLATAQSKCNAPTVYQTVAVVVTPAITNTDGITTIKPGPGPGNTTTYTVVITNNAGITFSSVNGNAAVFKDPAVANLTVTGVTCIASGGASCPGSVTVAGMQGAGLTIPTLPDGGSVTFSINASVNNGVPVGTLITNTASVTVNGQSNSASDTDTVVSITPPTAAISLTPACLYSGSAATFTMTVANGTGGAINTVAPSALTKGGTATIGAFTGPSPASIAAIADGASGTFTWTAPVTGNVNDTYFVTGYATSVTPAFTTATATSNTEDIDGYVVTVSPASTYAGSKNQDLTWTIANYGCNEISSVLINVPGGWTASNDGYALVTNTIGNQVDTWTFSGTTFTSDSLINNVQQGSTVNNFSLRFSATPSVTVSTPYTFNVTVTDASSPTPVVTVIPTTVTVNPYDKTNKGQGNFTGTAIWQEIY